VKLLTSLVLVVALSGCSEPELTLSDSEISSIEKVFSAAEQSPEVMEKWARSCALCHVNGEGGAPKMSDSGAWKPRIAQGNAILYTHTLEGLNRMPPLGYCMDCSGEDYATLINLLVGRTQ